MKPTTLTPLSFRQVRIRDAFRSLYGPEKPGTRPLRLRAVPYGLWDNRAAGSMAVWILRQP